MQHNQAFIEQLFRKYKIDASHHNKLLAEFLKEEKIIAACKQIQKNQDDMIDHWKKKVLLDDIQQASLGMPNATAGKEYSFSIDLSKKPFDGIVAFDMVEFETTGLSYEPTSKTIKGVPEAAGDYKLSFRFKIEEDGDWYDKQIKFLVNPNPKSLWKDLPSDETDPYWKADASQIAAPFGENFLVAASKRGRSHAHEGKFRDDEFDFLFLEETGWG
eukprot:gene40346-54568_t